MPEAAQFWVSVSEIVRNIGILIGGAIGIYLGWRRVTVANKQAEAQMRQADLARRDHVAELFNRAVAQLRDDKLEVRLGAIFTLREVCYHFVDLSDPVIETLTAFLRDSRIDYGDAEPPVDVREIARILHEVRRTSND